jgi:hypothetical protein
MTKILMLVIAAMILAGCNNPVAPTVEASVLIKMKGKSTSYVCSAAQIYCDNSYIVSIQGSLYYSQNI